MQNFIKIVHFIIENLKFGIWCASLGGHKDQFEEHHHTETFSWIRIWKKGYKIRSLGTSPNSNKIRAFWIFHKSDHLQFCS